MTRDGLASSSRSKNTSSTPEAVRENRLKLTPPSTTVAPRGELRPLFSPVVVTASPPRLPGVVPQADDRLVAAAVLEAEHADAGGAAVEEPPGGRRQPE